MLDIDNGDISLHKDGKDELLRDLMKIGSQVCELELWDEPDITYTKWEDIHRWGRGFNLRIFALIHKFNISLSTEKVEPPADNRMEAKT